VTVATAALDAKASPSQMSSGRVMIQMWQPRDRGLMSNAALIPAHTAAARHRVADAHFG
jgi:hypothetical protein